MNPLLYIDPQSAAIAAAIGLTGLLFICIFVSGIFYFKAKHNEKLLLIEKGLTDKQILKPNGNSLLKFGIIIIGLSVGLIINSIIPDFHGHDALMIAVVGICGGVSMIIANRLDKKE